MLNWRGKMGKARISEWMWRFLALVMLFAVGWSLWIFHQLNPVPLITDAAFQAAATAKVNSRQSVEGVIAPAGGQEPVPTLPALSAEPPAPADATPKPPPINADKLKFSESIAPKQ
jgi:hypothetical protein